MTFVWIGVMLAAIIIEMATPSALVTIWFALGALVAMLLAYLKLDLMVQILGFAIVSILSLCIFRPLASRYLRGNVVATNADRFIGEIGITTKPICENKWGEVLVQSTYWSAVEVDGKTIEEGKKVRVVAIEGAKLLVKEII